MTTVNQKDDMETQEEIKNKEILEHIFFDGLNKRDLSILDEAYAPDILYHAPSIEIDNFEDLKRLSSGYFSAFHDTTVTIEDLIAKGDKVTIRFIFQGIHKGALQEIQPTGKKMSITGISIYRLSDGKIVEEWEEFDQIGMMKQLGMELQPKKVV